MKIYDDDEEEETEGTDNMASNIIHVQRKLAATERFFIGSELDKHLREIDQNSRAVAHVSRSHYKTKITGLCDEVCRSYIIFLVSSVVAKIIFCVIFILVSSYSGHSLASETGGATRYDSCQP